MLTRAALGDYQKKERLESPSLAERRGVGADAGALKCPPLKGEDR
jgi:hypothetical protein